MTIQSIPVTDPERLPEPPCSGNWLRNPDGSLSPADEDTARFAGLWQDDNATE